jgi:integrase
MVDYYKKFFDLAEEMEFEGEVFRKFQTYMKHFSKLLPENQKLCYKFAFYNWDDNGVRPFTIITYIRRFQKLDEILRKDLTQVTKEDSKTLVRYLDKANYTEGTRMKIKSDYKTIRKYVNCGTLPKDVEWLNGKKFYDSRKVIEKTPDDILTPEDKDKLFFACENTRDRAIIMILRETGLRPKEFLSLKKSHISFDDTSDSNIITVPNDTKTGSRYVPFESSKPYLLEWLRNHPMREEKDYPLWINIGRGKLKTLDGKGLIEIFNTLKKRTKINKKVTPYSMRFGSITEKAQLGWSDQQLKAYHGHKADSKMLGVYVNMSGKDLTNKIKEMAGIVIKEDKIKPNITIITCPKCETENTNKDEFCLKCGKVLNLSTAQKLVESSKSEQDSLKNEIEKLKQHQQKQEEQFKDQIRKMFVEEIKKIKSSN